MSLWLISLPRVNQKDKNLGLLTRPSSAVLPPYPPRPRRKPGAEPSLDWRVKAAVAFLGARRVVARGGLRRRLELTGLTWDEIAPVLGRIRTINGWARTWRREAEASEGSGDFRRAAAQAFLGQIILSPFHKEKVPLLALLRRCHIRERQAQNGVRFERLVLAGGRMIGYRETPLHASKPPVLLLPPLASVKEELTLLGDPLLAAGHPVLRFDLPGQGESPAPLRINAERLLIEALDEAGVSAQNGCFVGGISLGAYFALRLAGADRARVRGVFGVSPPAIITPEQWSRQDEIIWQYLDLYFAADTRAETREIGLSMTLDDVISDVTCPVLLYHARHDPISLPDVAKRYQTALSHAPLTDQTINDWHGCILHLQNPIAPEVAAWCDRVTAQNDSVPSNVAASAPV